MQLAVLIYTYLFSSLCGSDLAFAVCSAGDCQPETEEVLNATLAVSNNHLADSKDNKRGSVRGIVLKSIHQEGSVGEKAWNDSVETALSAGGCGGRLRAVHHSQS